MSNGNSSSCPCCKALWVKFYLTAALETDSQSAQAKVLSDGSGVRQFWQGDDPDPNNNGFNVYNLESENPAGSTYQFSGDVNTVGLAVFDDTLDTNLPDADQQGRYRIVELQNNSFKRVTFITPTALTNQASLASCAVVLDWFDNAGGGTQITVYNEMGWQADAGVAGYADYRPVDGKWILMLIPCPAGNS
jgi:hypothetical protein